MKKNEIFKSDFLLYQEYDKFNQNRITADDNSDKDIKLIEELSKKSANLKLSLRRK